MKAGERERWSETKERDRDSNSPGATAPFNQRGKKTDLGINGSGSSSGPGTDRVLCRGRDTFMLAPGTSRTVLRFPGTRRAAAPAGAPAARHFQTVLSTPTPPLPRLLFSFCHFLLLYLLETHLRFVINQPQEQHLFFFFLPFFFFLKLILASWEARGQRVSAGEKEAGGIFAG